MKVITNFKHWFINKFVTKPKYEYAVAVYKITNPTQWRVITNISRHIPHRIHTSALFGDAAYTTTDRVVVNMLVSKFNQSREKIIVEYGYGTFYHAKDFKFTVIRRRTSIW